MAKQEFYPAPEVEEIADNLIVKYHSHLTDFDVRIEYVFSNKTPKKNGKEIWAYVRKISSLNAYLAGTDNDPGDFFVMVVSKPVWEILPHDKRMPLVDHELCHLWAEADQVDEDEADAIPDDPVKLSTNPHDVEEFSCIVRRWGLWREDVEDFVNAALKKKGASDEDEGEEEQE
jgi:predicted metallopeptidase